MILLMVVMLIMSAFFSASETALISSSPAKIQKLKMEGVKHAKTLLQLIDDKEKVVSVLLMGNSFVNIASSTLATAIAIDMIGESAEALAIATAIMSFIIIIYCEILPKTYAVRHAETTALKVAPICLLLIKVLNYINIIIKKIVDINLKIFRINAEPMDTISPLEEIKGAIEHKHEKGLVISEDKYMIGGLIDLETTLVNEVMIYRKDMFSVNIDGNLEAIITSIVNCKYSRIPVWQGSHENIIGIMHIKDLLKVIHKNKNSNISKKDLESILRKPWFIPDGANLKMQLQAFRDKHNHFAMVVNEYGELEGFITLEDIVEEVVGQIEDEYDEDAKKIIKNRDGSVTVAGDLSIRDLNREMHWNMPEKDVTTIGGLMFSNAQKIPDKGDVLLIDNYKLRLINKKHNKIIRVRIKKTIN